MSVLRKPDPKRSIRSINRLRSIPEAPIASDPPFEVTLDSRIQAKYADFSARRCERCWSKNLG